MKLPSRPCPQPGCPNNDDCSEHSRTRDYNRARRDDPSYIYNSVRWRKLRAVVLRRDPICKECNEEPSSDADHIIPIRQGGAPWSVENLQGLCAGCHSTKTQKESGGRASGCMGCRFGKLATP